MIQLTSLLIAILCVCAALFGCSGKGKAAVKSKPKAVQLKDKKKEKVPNASKTQSNTKSKTKTESTSTDNKTDVDELAKKLKASATRPAAAAPKPLEPKPKDPKPQKTPEVPKKSPEKKDKLKKKKPEASTALLDSPKDQKPKQKVFNKKSMYLEEKPKSPKQLPKVPSAVTLPTQTFEPTQQEQESRGASARRHRNAVKKGEMNEYSDDTIDDAPEIPKKEGKSCDTDKSLENVKVEAKVDGVEEKK